MLVMNALSQDVTYSAFVPLSIATTAEAIPIFMEGTNTIPLHSNQLFPLQSCGLLIAKFYIILIL